LNRLADKVKVLYIGGAGRSGSTILNNVLGQVDGFFATGELSLIWNWGVIENRPCSCGRPFHECEVWPRIFDEAFGGLDKIDAHRMWSAKSLVNSKNPFLHVAYTAAITTAARRRHPRLIEYAAALGKLYAATARVTGSRIIVDASKRPAYGYFIGTLPSVDLYVLHLIRDSRGIAFSRRRGKVDPGVNRAMRDFGPFLTGIQWSFWNASTEAIWNRPGSPRYMQLHYEDFVANPRQSLAAILNFVGEDRPLPLVGENQVMINPTHTVAGNPVRYDSGLTTLRLDDQWVRDIAPGDKALVTGLSWPLLLRYGYPLWPRAAVAQSAVAGK
jgi:hypothetical protein